MLSRNAVILSLMGLAIISAVVSAGQTIDRTVSGTVIGSSQAYNHEAPMFLFDNNVNTKWLTGGSKPTGWVQYEFPNGQAFAINSYAITSANDDDKRDPKVWTLYGSNDGATWTVLDSRSGETWAARYQRRVFKCTNTTPYRMYKLDVTQNNGNDTMMQFSELELIENGVSRTAYSKFSWSTQIGSAEGGPMVLDKRTDTKWLTKNVDPDGRTGWLQFQFLGKGAYAINGYAITSANDAPERDPKDWTLQGSHDGETWVVLDTRVGEFWKISDADQQRFVRHEFQFDNAVAYSYYKLDVTANNGSTNLMGFSEFELLERELPGSAKYVSPAELAYEVPVTAQLDWEAGVDPNDETVVWDAIGGHYVYLGKTPDNMTLQTLTALPAATTSYAPALDSNATYYWAVEEAVKKTEGGVYPAGDPNNVMGRVWRFSTETTVVTINPETPENAFAAIGGSASFSVAAQNPLGGTITYQWYFDPDINVEGDEVELTEGSKYQGAKSATLTIANVTEADKGAYFCGATNTGLVIYSNKANLYVKTLLAHWTLDAASYNGISYADATGLGHDATVVGTTPVFAGGIVDGDQNSANAAANGAIDTTDPNSCASAGAFNPSEETNAFSISAWVNWKGTAGIVNGMIASKRDGWASADESYWIFMVNNAGVLRIQAYGQNTINTSGNTIKTGQWHHVVMTYADGIARGYVDGLQVSVGGFGMANKKTATFWIGRNNAVNERFDGLLDDIKAFNYVLTPEEVVDLYYAETGKQVCIYGNPAGDFDGDCKVTIDDFASFAESWLTTGLYPVAE